MIDQCAPQRVNLAGPKLLRAIEAQHFGAECARDPFDADIGRRKLMRGDHGRTSFDRRSYTQILFHCVTYRAGGRASYAVEMNPLQRNLAESLVHHVGVLTIAATIACAFAMVAQAFAYGGWLAGLGAIATAPVGLLLVLYYLLFLLPPTYLLAPLWIWAAKTFAFWGQLAAIALTPIAVFAAITAMPLGPGASDFAVYAATIVAATAAVYYALEPRFA